MHSPNAETNINRLVEKWRDGDLSARDRLFACVYRDLRCIAQKQLRRMWGLDTINTTMLVHEAYLKLVEQSAVHLADRSHFLAVSATAMRQILINYSEKKRSQKQGGNQRRVALEEAIVSPVVDSDTLLCIEGALKHLSSLDERLGALVEMRFFGGMTEAEIGCVLNVTARTVRRDWRKAKVLLSHILAEQAGSVNTDDQ